MLFRSAGGGEGWEGRGLLVCVVGDLVEGGDADVCGVDAADGDDEGVPFVEDEGIFFVAFSNARYALHPSDGAEGGEVGINMLGVPWGYFNLRVEIGIEAADEVAETVEHGDDADEGNGGDGDTDGGDGGDDIDCAVALRGEEVAAGYEEG